MAVLNITSENYEKEVVGSKLPVLLHFQRFGIIVFNAILYSFLFPIKKLFFLTSRICLC